MLHELKCWPDYFARLADGSKTFEIRRNDRGYQAGDELLIREWSPSGDASLAGHTGRDLRFRVGFVASGDLFGLSLGEHVVLSLIPGMRDGEKTNG